jgi:hypothetical protein
MAAKKILPPHTIYALADPVTFQVRYVGRTGRTAIQRLRDHVQAAKRGDSDPVYEWIRSLAPRIPVLIILQEVQNDRVALPDGKYESRGEAAETKWMKRFERSPLFNTIKRNSRIYKRLVNQ